MISCVLMLREDILIILFIETLYALCLVNFIYFPCNLVDIKKFSVNIVFEHFIIMKLIC